MDKLSVPRWLTWILITVECMEAAGSAALLFLSPYDTTALPLITTHCVLFIFVTRVFVGFFREEKESTPDRLEAGHPVIPPVTEPRRASKRVVIRYLSITASAVFLSILLLLVSVFTKWFHTVSIQACISMVVMSKGHLRKDFLDLREKATVAGSIVSTTELVSTST